MIYPKIVIVILNYRRWKETSDCVVSLEQCTYPNFEILLVDNCSPDGSEQKLKEFFPDIKIIQTGKNLGYTGGVNVGIRQAQKMDPAYILLLNEDTLVNPDFLHELVNAMEGNPGAAAACGTIYHHPEKNLLWYAGGKIISWRGLAIHYTSPLLLKSGSQKKYRKVTFVTGCMTMIRASLLDTLGLRDERFFMSLEDIEYSARILRLGYDLLYVPGAIIYHRIPVKYDSLFNLYYSVRNRLLLIDTSIASPVKLLARIYFLIVIIGKLILWKFWNPRYFKAARFGLSDYFSHNFYEGRGIVEFTR